MSRAVFYLLTLAILLLTQNSKAEIRYEVYAPKKVGLFSIENPKLISEAISRREGAVDCLITDIGNIVEIDFRDNHDNFDLDHLPTNSALQDLLYKANRNKRSNYYNAIIGARIYFNNDGKLMFISGTPIRIICRKQFIIFNNRER